MARQSPPMISFDIVRWSREQLKSHIFGSEMVWKYSLSIVRSLRRSCGSSMPHLGAEKNDRVLKTRKNLILATESIGVGGGTCRDCLLQATRKGLIHHSIAFPRLAGMKKWPGKLRRRFRTISFEIVRWSRERGKSHIFGSEMVWKYSLSIVRSLRRSCGLSMPRLGAEKKDRVLKTRKN